MNFAENGRGRLVALEFFDKENKSLLKVGWYAENAGCSYHEIVLEDNERVVGIQSGSRGETNALHYDF